MPISLLFLSLTENHITSLPHLFRLVHLQELNLSGNKLSVLPNDLHKLYRLRSLNISHNLLISLCILPRSVAPIVIEEDDSEKNPNDWKIQIDPVLKTAFYFHKKTKKITRIMPTCLMPKKMEVPPLPLDKLNNGVLNAPEVESDQQRPDSAFQAHEDLPDWEKYPGGWEINVLHGACIEFTHRPSKTHYTEYVLDKILNKFVLKPFILLCRLPPELDRFASFEDLQFLNLSGNQLYNLPDSIVRSYTIYPM